MASDPRAVDQILRLLEQALDDIGGRIPGYHWARLRDRFTELCELENINLTATIVPANGDPDG